MKETNLNCVLFCMKNEVTFKFFVDNKMKNQYTHDNNYREKESLDSNKSQEITNKKDKRFMVNKE